jgi:hypothetical protein
MCSQIVRNGPVSRTLARARDVVLKATESIRRGAGLAVSSSLFSSWKLSFLMRSATWPPVAGGPPPPTEAFSIVALKGLVVPKALKFAIDTLIGVCGGVVILWAFLHFN